ncbi:MAG: hypothetical protein QXO48_01610 [Desulfurococcaceae archaeon]
MHIKGKPFRDLTLEKAVRLGAALGKLAGAGSLVISGRDASPVSRMFKRAITAGIMSAGVEVMDFHESLLGEISYAIRRFGGRYGFMVEQDPATPGNIVIRVCKTPGYELRGAELKSILSESEKEIEEPERVGWIIYAEYMHRLYSSAVSSFVKSDAVSSAKITTVVGPGLTPLDVILRDLSSDLGVDQTLIGVTLKSCIHPSIELMEDVEKVVDAIGADVGAVFSHDGSSIVVYSTSTGYLVPGELALVLSERYPAGSKVLALNPVQKTIVKTLVGRGYDVIVVNSVEEYNTLLRRERPVLSFTPHGEFASPIFSLCGDAVVVYAQVLEVLSEQGKQGFTNIVETELKVLGETVSKETALTLCREKGAITLWGCLLVENSTVTALVYQPRTGAFLKIRDSVAPPTGH